MFINQLFTIVIFSLLAFAQSASAEENLDVNTHLPYIQVIESNSDQRLPQLIPATHIATPEILDSKLLDSESLNSPEPLNTKLSTASPATTAKEPLPVDDASENLWQRIRNGFAMQDLDSGLIAKHEKWYSGRPEYMTRMTERSQRYLFYITEEVELRGMPSEIALLPMIESAFNPGAYSVGKASGIWQFIPSTGKHFGMQQNWWHDERRDIISATNGALDYLQKLHNQFGDWQLALAAYNWGEGAVARAQMRNRKLGKPTDYASLKLPPETQNYVPKLLAIKNIVSHPEQFGIALTDIPNRPYFGTVVTSQRIDVKLAAELADISLEEFVALNPSHNRPVILQDNSVLLLPIDKVDIFKNNLENTNQRLVSWQPYKTKRGENFDHLAPRFGLSANQLRSINGLSSRAKISNGQTLLVPDLVNDLEENDFAAFNTHLVSIDEPLSSRVLKHTVRKGETLKSIAKRYRVSPGKLAEWNSGLKKIKVGQRITIVQRGAHQQKTRLAKSSKQRKHAKLARGNKKHTGKVVRNTKSGKPKNNIKVALNR
ncbi:MAG: transglycosylase SLT domain-containing protein [Gallionellaceae bacterium]